MNSYERIYLNQLTVALLIQQYNDEAAVFWGNALANKLMLKSLDLNGIESITATRVDGVFGSSV